MQSKQLKQKCGHHQQERCGLVPHITEALLQFCRNHVCTVDGSCESAKMLMMNDKCSARSITARHLWLQQDTHALIETAALRTMQHTTMDDKGGEQRISFHTAAILPHNR
ncbi:hypothetical protein HNY73_010480 [Argiope bruennichi]|uniref:Uncharacterized protein n=1 Tax=Argiope bruennichi TaxID=94029 RepID=A0A8T0F165_ARGBR|nr:hypothetical protein HNY73_010480 [Argiope bruennichi]